MKARWQDHRSMTKRIVVSGTLKLTTPARLGNGDVEDLTDMPLARDPWEGRALLTGASIAGAARNYAREWLYGYGQDGAEVQDLFGDIRKRADQEVSEESWLIVDDALAVDEGLELRDGVTIDPRTRTAEPGKLFDYELLEADTCFPLRFELTVTEQNEAALRRTLAAALTGFERGEIGLGARKRRGLGECRVPDWTVQVYDLTSRSGLIHWLEGAAGVAQSGQSIAEKLGVQDLPPDQRQCFVMEALFHLESSLLIRSGSGDSKSPDMVHLKSKRDGQLQPIVSGTSLAGAIRARAARIANTVAPDRAEEIINDLFGPRFSDEGDRNKPKHASRVVVHESVIEQPIERVQSRVKIDRFTGGSYPGALFDQQPVFGGQKTQLRLKIEVCAPQPAEIGLLLQVLKDLWTGDLPLGGESSVGRGRLQGLEATLTDGPQHTWVFHQADGRLSFSEGTPAELEQHIAALGGK
jgi:CRISPR/Cas system CSM-associated protein Csm3 (group 7 of RAMP superfamily)